MVRNLEVLFLFLIKLADRIVIVILLHRTPLHVHQAALSNDATFAGSLNKHLVFGVRGIRVLSRMRCLQL